MSKCFRYDVIGADLDCGVKMHPQEDMRSLGFSVLRSEPNSIAECWFFEVDDKDENYKKICIPSYIEEIESDYFTRERKSITKVQKCDKEDYVDTPPGFISITPIKADGTLDKQNTQLIRM